VSSVSFLVAFCRQLLLPDISFSENSLFSPYCTGFDHILTNREVLFLCLPVLMIICRSLIHIPTQQHGKIFPWDHHYLVFLQVLANAMDCLHRLRFTPLLNLIPHVFHHNCVAFATHKTRVESILNSYFLLFPPSQECFS